MKQRTAVVVVCVLVAVLAIMLATHFFVDTGIRVELDHPPHFYEERAAQTRAYLGRVYPLAVPHLGSMDAAALARVYTALGFVYNCCYTYRGELASGGGWDALACCALSGNRIPYALQGYVYFWMTYAALNKHTVYSDGVNIDGKPHPAAHMGSQRVDVPWGSRADGGEVDRANRSGPGPYWVPGYTLLRNIYYPFGPVYDESFKRWTYRNGIDADNGDNMGFLWKASNWTAGAPQRGRGWAFGAAAGEYVEVAHSSYEPGMAQSPGLWLTPWVGGGTGVFYRVGRTIVANNKMGAVFKLLNMLRDARARDLDMPDLTAEGLADFSRMSGREILHYWFKTDDPYTIVWRYCARDGVWGAMSRTASGGALVLPSQWVGIDNKGVLAATGLFNPGQIGTSGQPYGPNAAVDFAEVAAWYARKHGLGDKPLAEQVKFAVDGAARSADYLLDRVCTIVTFDEPIFWLANVLGYETVQMPVSANGNGLWSPEIIHTAVPNRAWARLAKGRIYSWITGDDRKSMFDTAKDAPRYTPEGLETWQETIARIITQRNPFDLGQGAACAAMGPQTGKFINYSDKFWSQAAACAASENGSRCWRSGTNDYGFATPQCATNGQWGVTVDGAAALPGRTFWGHYSEKKGCFPVYENIYCADSLSSDYSMLRIFTGKDLGR